MAERDAGAAALTPLTSPYQVSVQYGGFPVANGGQASGWFGPQKPMVPVAPADTAGRRFDFPTGYNLNSRPRTYERIGFAELRALADNYDLLRMVIESRKDQIERASWSIAPRSDLYGPNKKPPSKAVLDQARELELFFRKPDRENTWRQWLRMLMEDMLVIDAPTLYRRKTRGGGLYSLDVIDGATIKPVIDDWGRRPLPPEPAYQQILKGLPAVNYTSDDLIYRPRNVRSNRVYGFSPVEQVIMTVNIALRRQAFQLQYYTEGNVPEALIGVPATWTPDQIRAFQAYWDSLMEGNTASRRHAKFVPGEMSKSFTMTKEPELTGKTDEWLARVVCFCLSVSSQPFVSQINRGEADVASETALDEGLAPTQSFLKDVIDDVLVQDFGVTELELKWGEHKEIDPDKEAARIVSLSSKGLMRINEGRAILGMEPDPDPYADKLGVVTASGFVPIEVSGAPKPDPVQLDENGQPVPAPIGGKKSPKAVADVQPNEKTGKAEKAAKKTMYVSRQLTNAKDIIAWAKAQGFAKTLSADDMHVTIAFSKVKVDWSAAGDTFDTLSISMASEQKNGARSVEKLGDKGAVVLRFESTELAKRWQEFVDAGASWDWPGYKPHVTITYDGADLDLSAVLPYDGPLEFGPEKFAEVDTSWDTKVKEVGKAANIPFAKGWRTLPPIKATRAFARTVTASLAARTADVLKTVGKHVATEVREALSGVAKADETDDERDRRIQELADQIAASVDLSGLDALVDVTAEELDGLVKNTAGRVLAQLGVNDKSDLVDQVNERAVEAANDRAAELVGMRYNADGELVENPNAVFRIDTGTRDMIRRAVAEGLDENIGLDEIVANIEDLGFSDERAQLIAETEVSRANSDAALEGYRGARDAGVNVKKEWILGENPCPICEENAAEGVIEIDDEFPSGDDASPAHPRCECAVSPVVEDDGEDSNDE